MPARIILLTTILVAAMAGSIRARELPFYSVNDLCIASEIIVQVYVAGDDVKIQEVYFGKEKLGDKKAMTIPGLANIRAIAAIPGPEGKPKTKVAMLFLDADGNLAPVGLDDHSPAVYWMADKDCYTYSQRSNPGGYTLVRGDAKFHADTADSLVAAVKDGVKISSQWKEALAITDHAKAAAALAKFLRVETAPHGYMREFDRPLRERMGQLGEAAVGPVEDVLRAGLRTGEDLNTAVIILYDLGKPAGKATDTLLKLLETPGKTAVYYICCALTAGADPRAIPALRPLLRDSDTQIAMQAALALGAMKDGDSFNAIATMADGKIEQKRFGEARELVLALCNIDEKRGRELGKKFYEQTLGHGGDGNFGEYRH